MTQVLGMNEMVGGTGISLEGNDGCFGRWRGGHCGFT